jgi:hypothetical protein
VLAFNFITCRYHNASSINDKEAKLTPVEIETNQHQTMKISNWCANADYKFSHPPPSVERGVERKGVALLEFCLPRQPKSFPAS